MPSRAPNAGARPWPSNASESFSGTKMLPDRLIETSVTRNAAAIDADVPYIRALAGLTPTRLDDAKLDERIVSAAMHIEKRTRLKPFSGTYRAEFRRATLILNNNWQFRPLVIPGPEAMATAVTLDGADILPSIAVKSYDVAGSQRLYPPPGGWLTYPREGDGASLFVDFRAGGTLPPYLQEILAITVRWHYDQRPEDRDILRDQFCTWYLQDAT